MTLFPEKEARNNFATAYIYNKIYGYSAKLTVEGVLSFFAACISGYSYTSSQAFCVAGCLSALSVLFCFSRFSRALLSIALFLLAVPATYGAQPEAGKLVTDLSDRDSAVRQAAEKQLVKMGPETIPVLLAGLDNVRRHDGVVRVFSAKGCEAVDGLLKLLEKDDLRAKAGSMLFHATNSGCVKHIGAYLACMDNSKAGNYCGAALVRTSGPKAKSWLSEVAKRLTTGDKDARAYAAAAIGEMGTKAASAVPALIAAMKDPVPQVRLAAVAAVRKTGVGDGAVADALKNAASDPDSEVRREAGETYRLLRIK